MVLVVAAFYVIAAFTLPNPLTRIAMRCLPVLPVAIWTLWFDRSRPLRRQSTLVQTSGRIALLIAVMAVAVLILGIGLNWLYDPTRVV